MNVWSVKLPFAEYSVVKDLPAIAGRRQAASSFRGPLSIGRVEHVVRVFQLTTRQTGCKLESLDSGLPRAQSPRVETGGEYRARTGDLLVANQALSQLS